MNPFQIMELNKPNFTPNDLLIYETILNDPAKMIYMTTSQLAETCGVSQPALSRFVKGLGYSRYQDFRAELISCLANKTELDALGSGHLRYFNVFYQLLGEAEQLLTADFIKEQIHYINKFDHVFASGMAKSYHPALLLEILSRKARRNIHAVPHDLLLELGDSMTENDLLIVFSVSAKPVTMDDAVHANGKILLITANPHHKYHEAVDKEILLPYVPPNPEESPVSPILFDIFVELLVSFMIQEIT